jgi:hypothetical protein
MRKRFRSSTLGDYHKVDVSRGNLGAIFLSDAELKGLIEFLNAAEAKPDGVEIVQIVEEMLQLEAAEEPNWGATKAEQEFASGPNARPMTIMRHGKSVINPLLKNISPDKYRRQSEIDKVQMSLDARLSRRTFYPRVWWAGNRWVVFWRIPSRMRLRKGIMELDDAGALRMILDLARGGFLSRLRRCSRCHKWLYAKFRHQNFCSTECQQKHYKDSPEWRKKRRDYMRGYRRQTMEW